MDDLKVETPKTRVMKDLCEALAGDDRRTLLVTAGYAKNVVIASRNVPELTVRTARDVNTLDVLSAVRVIVEQDARKTLEDRLS